MEVFKIIARVKSVFPAKFGIPRQSNLVKGLRSSVIFEREFRNPEAVRGLEDFSHIWLIWGFSEARMEKWSPTVRPPRLGGNTRIGVFATRSPFRPNPIGLSSVKLDGIEMHFELGPVLHISGSDLMDGSPIYDIKPYVPYTDSHPDAGGGFADGRPGKSLSVIITEKCKAELSEEMADILSDLLAYDPRPSYQDDPDRVYGMKIDGFEIKFTVKGHTLTVIDVF